MRFGEAIEYARRGYKIARLDWYGTGMYVYMTNAHTVTTYAWMEKMPSQKLTEAEKRDGGVLIESHLDMMTARGARIIGWSPTNADILSNDWYVVDREESRITSIDLAKEKVKAEGLRSLKDRIELEGGDMNSAYPKVVN